MERPYRLTKKRLVLEAPPIRLVSATLLTPAKKKLHRYSIEHPGCAVIIPEIRPGYFVLIRQYRYAVRDYLWEIPAGGREAGETFRQAARRELMEEIGCKPGKLKKIAAFYPTPGISEEKMELFHASCLSPALRKGDDDEDIRVHILSQARIRRMLRRGEIIDGKTILAFGLLWKNF